MTKVRDILTDSLVELGVLDPSENISADAAKHALREFNRMIQTWNIEDLMVYTVNRQTFPLVPGQQVYTIGVGGNFNTTTPIRPGQIDMVSVLFGTPAVEIPIDILNDEEWRDMSVKQVNSTFPLMVWSNGNYPLNQLSFWPVPQMVNDVVLYIWGQTTSFTNINADVTFPQGYEDLMVPSLALRLGPSYGVTPSSVTAAKAQSAKTLIKRMNWEPTYRSADSAIMGNGTGADIWRKSRGYVLD